jgi:hypothetical protein
MVLSTVFVPGLIPTVMVPLRIELLVLTLIASNQEVLMLHRLAVRLLVWFLLTVPLAVLQRQAVISLVLLLLQDQVGFSHNTWATLLIS